MSRAAIFSFMPVLTKLLPESVTSIERGRYYRNRFHEITEKWIREHRRDYRGNRMGDLQDAYIEKINNGEETFSSEGLAAMVREIFIIGNESESVMMRWAIRILSCNPKVQDKIQAEMDNVAGRGQEVTWEMRDRLPYTRAVIMEIQRFADIAPTGLLHKTVCDVSLGGFNLPQDTLVMANLSACHRDTRFWKKPEEFYPEHFLGAGGEVIENKEGFLPYGVGKRVCPGAKLADMQIFLILTNILTEYRLSLPKGDKGDLGTQFKAGTSVLRNPKPYRVVVDARAA
jgi:cytochrome P450 family 2 subfamily K